LENRRKSAFFVLPRFALTPVCSGTAQQRLWRHEQAASARLRQDSRQRGKEGAIGWDQRRAPPLPAKYQGHGYVSSLRTRQTSSIDATDSAD
jgi:hypothetical protein